MQVHSPRMHWGMATNLPQNQKHPAASSRPRWLATRPDTDNVAEPHCVWSFWTVDAEDVLRDACHSCAAEAHAQHGGARRPDSVGAPWRQNAMETGVHTVKKKTRDPWTPRVAALPASLTSGRDLVCSDTQPCHSPRGTRPQAW